MTSIVGVLCEDGVVIGSDSAATFGSADRRTIEQPYEKLEIISNGVIFAPTGSVGFAQRFSEIIKNAYSKKEFEDASKVSKKLSGEFIKDLLSTGLRFEKLGFGALVAFPSKTGLHLCEFDTSTFQPEFKTEKMWYVSLGCAQDITDPFLGFIRDIYWSDGQPTVNEAIFAVIWTLQHAIDVNTGGVKGPIRIATLQKNKYKTEVKILDETEMHEHQQFISHSKEQLRQMRKSNPNPPDIPK